MPVSDDQSSLKFFLANGDVADDGLNFEAPEIPEAPEEPETQKKFSRLS